MIRMAALGRTIRSRITLVALLPLLATMIVVFFLGSYLIDAWIIGEAQKKVRRDLEAARAEYDRQGEEVLDTLWDAARLAGSSSSFISSGFGAGRLQSFLDQDPIDFLTLTDEQGRVTVRGSGSPPSAPGNEFRTYVDAALNGQSVVATLLVPEADLQRENPELSVRARIEAAAGAGVHSADTGGRVMLVFAACPVKDAHGKVTGSLYGGVLINHNLELVDRIKHLAYGDERFEGRSLGSATLFLEDVRVATTVRLDDGRRALGTRMSREVAQAVLEEQKTWIDRARVVDDWYLTAYEPLQNPAGQTVGALYVGLLEAPYRALRTRATLVLAAVMLTGAALGYLLAARGARTLARPIRELAEMAQGIARGASRADLRGGGCEELDRLTSAFNQMTHSLHEREEELRRLNQSLELKVAERTRALEDKNQQLLRAQQELARNEKLAAIGALAAGVAHEINNPTAIIRGNTELLLMELSEGAAGREEAEEVKKQTDRISRITGNLLTYARRRNVKDGPPHTLNPVDINHLLDDILVQLPHQVDMTDVTIERDYDMQAPQLSGDAGQLRQVFVNLLLNAVEAMSGKGVLHLSTTVRGDTISVAIADDGPGMKPEHADRIFDPFFTTKKQGTGLGLSVSYGIVQHHGGTITVSTAPEQGTTFTVSLPFDRRQH